MILFFVNQSIAFFFSLDEHFRFFLTLAVIIDKPKIHTSLIDIADMVVYSVYIVSRGGSLIYDLDYFVPKTDVEKTFSYPLEIVLKVFDEKLTVDFGARDGIKGIIGFTFPSSLGRPLHIALYMGYVT